jgi:citrate synthase
MRGITGLTSETSLLDAQMESLRGYSIPELREKVAKAPHGDEPLLKVCFI